MEGSWGTPNLAFVAPGHFQTLERRVDAFPQNGICVTIPFPIGHLRVLSVSCPHLKLHLHVLWNC